MTRIQRFSRCVAWLRSNATGQRSEAARWSSPPTRPPARSRSGGGKRCPTALPARVPPNRTTSRASPSKTTTPPPSSPPPRPASPPSLPPRPTKSLPSTLAFPRRRRSPLATRSTPLPPPKPSSRLLTPLRRETNSESVRSATAPKPTSPSKQTAKASSARAPLAVRLSLFSLGNRILTYSESQMTAISPPQPLPPATNALLIPSHISPSNTPDSRSVLTTWPTSQLPPLPPPPPLPPRPIDLPSPLDIPVTKDSALPPPGLPHRKDSSAISPPKKFKCAHRLISSRDLLTVCPQDHIKTAIAIPDPGRAYKIMAPPIGRPVRIYADGVYDLLHCQSYGPPS